MNIDVASAQRRSLWHKILHIVQDELLDIQVRLCVANLLTSLLPVQIGSRLRAASLRMAGFHIGSETAIYGHPMITGGGDIYTRLTIGHDCRIEIGCVLDLEDHITIGNRVTVGHQTMILTSSHEIGSKACRAGAVTRAPVTIGDGVWIGPRCIILPGVTIGAGAVVAAGALVNKSVPSNTYVSGSPAREVERDQDDILLEARSPNNTPFNYEMKYG